MASDAFIKEFKKSSKQIVPVLRIQDPEGVEISYTSKPDWDASATLSYIDTDEFVGSIAPRYELAGTNQNTFTHPSGFESPPGGTTNYGNILLTPVIDSFLYQMRFRVSFWAVPAATGLYNVTIKLRSGSAGGTVIFSETFSLTFIPVAGFQYIEGETTNFYQTAWTQPTFTIPRGEMSASTNYYVTATIVGVGDTGSDRTYSSTNRYGYGIEVGQTIADFDLVPKNGSDCFVLTSTIDLSAYTGSVVFGTDDTALSGSSIEYRIFADNFDPPTTDRGSFSDGESVTKYDYYRIKPKLSSTTGQRAQVHSLSLTVGEDVFISSEVGIPNARTKPVLLPKSIKNLASNISLTEGPTFGQGGFGLVWNKYSGDLVKTGFMSGKDISMYVGTSDLPFTDFEKIFAGSWIDYNADATARRIDVKTQHIIHAFKQTKLPQETVDSAGARTTVNLVFTATNVIQAMLDVIDAVGVKDRYIDRAAAEALRDGFFNGAIWDVTRTIDKDKPEAAFTLLEELSIISGVFLVILPSGVMTFTLYDDTATPSVTLNADYAKDDVLEGRQKDLKTRQFVYYNPAVANPTNQVSDFSSYSLFYNTTAETLWDQAKELRFFEKWDLGQEVVDRLIFHRDGWFAQPRIRTTLQNIPIHKIGDLTPGEIITVKNMEFPTEEASYPDSADKTCLVMGWRLLPHTGNMEVDLLDIQPPDIHYPVTMTVANAASFTGTVADLQDLDSTYVQVNEAASQMWSVELEFQTHPEADVPKYLDLNGRYQGSSSHTVRVQVWDVNASSPSWLNLGTLPNSTIDQYHSFLFHNGFVDMSSANYGVVKVRIYHESNGAAGHFLLLDRVRVIARES